MSKSDEYTKRSNRAFDASSVPFRVGDDQMTDQFVRTSQRLWEKARDEDEGSDR